jgi:small subunit ribosomal protein S6
VKRYEGLFILDIAGKEENLKDILDRITGEITTLGGKIETVQKMDKRNFARVKFRRHAAGFYANVIFEAKPEDVAQLRTRFGLNHEVFRVLFTESPAPAPKPEPVPAT